MSESKGVEILLERCLQNGVLPSWGFRIHGGRDFNHSLTILRVSPGSVADRAGIWSGDVIERINDKDTTNLLHLEAQQLIKEAGDRLRLVVKRHVEESCGIYFSEEKNTKASDSEPIENGITSEHAGDKMDNNLSGNEIVSPGTASSHKQIDEKSSDAGECAPGPENSTDLESVVRSSTPTEELEFESPEAEKILDSSPNSSDNISNTSEGPQSPTAPPLPTEPAPDSRQGFYRKPAVETASNIEWTDQKSEPTQGRTMKLLQMKLSVGDNAESDGRGSPDTTSDQKSSQADPKPFVSSTLRLLQEEDEEKKQQGPPRQRSRRPKPSENAETAGEPALGRTMKMLQQQLKLGGDNPLPSTLSPEYSKSHARPITGGGRVKNSFFLKSEGAKTDPVLEKPSKPDSPNGRDTAKPNVGPNYRYYAGLKSDKTEEDQPKTTDTKWKDTFAKKRNSLESTGHVGGSKVFDTWTGVWKEPEPAKLGTYQHTNQIPSAPNTATDKDEVNAPSKGVEDTDAGSVGQDGKPLCASCKQSIRGAFVSAVGKTFCPDHFMCSYCSINLSASQFVEEDGKIFCQEDYELLYSPRCATCDKTIFGHAVKAIAKSYHPECFVCAKCKRPFEGDGFMLEKGEPYCQKDYDEIFAVRCGKCRASITGGERYIEALGKEWHIPCFSCSVCSTPLEGTSFFVVNGQPYCKDHKGMKR